MALHAEVHPLPDGGAVKGVDLLAADAEKLSVGKVPPAIDGLAQGVDDPAPQELAHFQRQLAAGVAHEIAGGNAAHVGVGHQQDAVVLKAHHLGVDLLAGLAVVNAADVAHGGVAAGGLDGHTHDVFDLASEAVSLRVINLSNHIAEHAPPASSDFKLLPRRVRRNVGDYAADIA